MDKNSFLKILLCLVPVIGQLRSKMKEKLRALKRNISKE